MYNPQRAPRPQLTLAILKYAVLDVLGMLVFALGFAYLTRGAGVFFPRFPGSTLEALLLTGGGGMLMFWAGTRILREIARQHTAGEQAAEAVRSAHAAGRTPAHRDS